MKTPTKLVISVSIFFTILFTAFFAFQFIITKIHEDQGDRSLGPFLLAVNYSSFMICNIFVSKFSNRYSQKWMMTIPALAYSFNYIIGLFIGSSAIALKYLLTALGGIINGIGSSFLWTNLGTYIHKVCHLYEVWQKKGFYYGLFSMIYTFSSILGATVITFGIELFTYNEYFVITSSLALLSFFYAVLMVKDLKTIQGSKEDHVIKQTQSISIKQQFLKTMRYYPVMKYIIGCIFIDGINLGVTSSTILHLLPEQSSSKLNIGFCLLALGFGGVIGGFFGGKICDKIPIKKVLFISLALHIFNCLSSAISYQNKEVYFAIGCSCMWGFSMYSLQGVLMVACSRLYNGTPQSFSIVKQLHSLIFVLYEIMNIPTNNSLPLDYIMVGVVLFVVPAAYGVTKLPYEHSTQKETLISSQSQF